MAWIIITLGTIFLLILSLCAMGWFPSIAVLIFLWLFTYLPFSRKGMIVCCGLNTTQTEHVSKTRSIIFVENSHMLLQGTESWFLAKRHFFSHRTEIEWQKKGKESQAAEALSYILQHYFAMPEAGSCPTWVGDPSSGRLIGKMTFTDLDCADAAINWKNIGNTWTFECRLPCEVVSSFHCISCGETNFMQGNSTCQGLQSCSPGQHLHPSTTTASGSRLSCHAHPLAVSCMTMAWVVKPDQGVLLSAEGM